MFSAGSKSTVNHRDEQREDERRAIQAPMKRGPGSPPRRDWSGRNKRGSRQGISPHLYDRPFVVIGWPLGSFQAPLRSFLHFFFPSRAPRRPLLSGLPASRTFVSICSTLRRIGALASRCSSLPPPPPLSLYLSLPVFICVIIIVIISIFIGIWQNWNTYLYPNCSCFAVIIVIIIVVYRR